MSTPSMYAPGHIILYMVIFMALAIKSYWRFWIEVKVYSLKKKNGNLHINKRFNALLHYPSQQEYMKAIAKFK